MLCRTDPTTSALVDNARTTMADQIRFHFHAELQTLSRTQSDGIVASIAALTSVESWEQSRRSLHRTPAQPRHS